MARWAPWNVQQTKGSASKPPKNPFEIQLTEVEGRETHDEKESQDDRGERRVVDKDEKDSKVYGGEDRGSDKNER